MNDKPFQESATSKCAFLWQLWRRLGLTPMQILVPLVPGGLVLGAALGASLYLGIEIRMLLGDPAGLGGMHPLTGVVSNLGIIAWSATSSICLFTAPLLRARGAREMFWFVLCAGILTAYLLFDDLFQFHETLGLRYFGVPEIWVYGFLIAAIAIFLIRFRMTILRSDFGLLLLAIGFLGVSTAIDLVPRYDSAFRIYWLAFAEEGPKWLGILCWCAYYVRYCYLALGDPDRSAGS